MTVIFGRGGRHVALPAMACMHVFAHDGTAGAAYTDWWDLDDAITSCIVAYQPKGAASYVASKVNLANPGTYDAVNGTAYPSWAAETGWTFTAASSQYLTMGTISGSQQPITYIARVTPSGTGNRAIFGTRDGNGWEFRISSDTKQNLIHQNVAIIGSSSSAVSGDTVIGVTYSAAGTYVFYLSGSSDGSGTNDKSGAGKQIIGSNGTTAEFFNGIVVALAIYSAILSGDEMATLSTAMAAL